MLENEARNYLLKLDFESARTIFLLESKMLDVKENYKRKYEPNLRCDICERKNEKQLHIFECEGYSDIMEKIKRKESVNKILEENYLKEIAKAIGIFVVV